MFSSHKFLLAFLTGSLALAQSSKISEDLQGIDLKASVAVIVQFDKDPTDMHHQKVINRGGVWRATLHSLRAGAYSVPAGTLADLARDPSVLHISQDHKIAAKLDYTAAAINAPASWNLGWDGSGVGVAVLDSGISPGLDLNGKKANQRIVYKQDFTGGDAADHYGHGEHVAGIIAGNGYSSECGSCTRKLRGIAPNANLINLRVLDSNGESNDSTVIAAIETAIELKNAFNIRVLNLSLGRPVFESYKLDPLCQAAEAAWKAGIVVVAAAGNEGRDNSVGNQGYGTITAPGNDPFVITVGAMKTMGTYNRADDLIASYSSKGPTMIDNIVKPDIVAPGNKVVSLRPSNSATLPREYPQNLIPASYYNGSGVSDSTQYYMLSGTSMAAAAVSGAVADLIQAEPGLTPDQVKVRLMKTASKTFPQSSVATDPVTGLTYTSYYDIFTVGAGYLDLHAALQDRDQAWGAAASPAVDFDRVQGKLRLSFERSSVWSISDLPGSRTRSGTAETWGAAVIHADRSLWGDSAPWTSSSAWASSGVWGSAATLAAQRSLWGESTATEAASSQVDATSILLAGEQ